MPPRLPRRGLAALALLYGGERARLCLALLRAQRRHPRLLDPHERAPHAHPLLRHGLRQPQPPLASRRAARHLDERLDPQLVERQRLARLKGR